MAYIGPFPIVLPNGMSTTTGNISITNGSLSLPDTTSVLTNGQVSSVSGVIDFSGVAWVKNNPTGSNNIWIGPGSGNLEFVTGIQNTSVGGNSLQATEAGGNNSAFGFGTLSALVGGSYNLSVGYNSGSSYTASESSNITLNATGTASESNTLRIGSGTGTGNQQLQSAFISGISGVTVANSAAVLINTTTGQLGTVSSSLRFKENVKDMKESNILKLRPVNFTYKKDDSQQEQWGLIAEEVHEVFPSLVTYDSSGYPSTVRYHDLPAILLNEIKKLNKRIEILESNSVVA
jgi:hypothetical protein